MPAAARVRLPLAALVLLAGCASRFPERDAAWDRAAARAADLAEAHPLGDRGFRLDLIESGTARSLHLAQMSAPLPRHVHRDHTEIATVLRGRGVMEIDGRTFDAPEGARFVIPPGVPHSGWPAGGGTLVALVVYEPPMPAQDDREPAPPLR